MNDTEEDMKGIHYNTMSYQLISAKQAAEIFGVETLAVTRWARNGIIPFTRLPNGRLRFSKDWCTEYMKLRGKSNGQHAEENN